MIKDLRKTLFFSLCFLLVFTGCQKSSNVVNNVNEREANEIIVFLASKGIKATKTQAVVETGTGGNANMWNIVVKETEMTQSMALLNQNGLPRQQGTSLLELFGAANMMTSDKEETIRYQAGLAEELKSTIRKMDGVLDVDVQIAFPSSDTVTLPGTTAPKLSASVYIKHQGLFDDPNSHLEMKIKRLVAGSISELDYDKVTVVTDRARIADIDLSPAAEMLSAKSSSSEYVKIWSVFMNKESAGRFRTIFIMFIMIIILFGGIIGYLIYRFYPQLQVKKEKPSTIEEEQPPS